MIFSAVNVYGVPADGEPVLHPPTQGEVAEYFTGFLHWTTNIGGIPLYSYTDLPDRTDLKLFASYGRLLTHELAGANRVTDHIAYFFSYKSQYIKAFPLAASMYCLDAFLAINYQSDFITKMTPVDLSHYLLVFHPFSLYLDHRTLERLFNYAQNSGKLVVACFPEQSNASSVKTMLRKKFSWELRHVRTGQVEGLGLTLENCTGFVLPECGRVLTRWKETKGPALVLLRYDFGHQVWSNVYAPPFGIALRKAEVLFWDKLIQTIGIEKCMECDAPLLLCLLQKGNFTYLIASNLSNETGSRTPGRRLPILLRSLLKLGAIQRTRML